MHSSYLGEDPLKSVISALRQKDGLVLTKRQERERHRDTETGRQRDREEAEKAEYSTKRSTSVKVRRWKRTQYPLQTASVRPEQRAREQSGEKVNRNLVPEGSFYSGRLGEALKEHVANNHDPYLRTIYHSGRNWRESTREQGERGRLRMKLEIEQWQWEKKEMERRLVVVFRNGTRQHLLLTG